MELYIRDIYWEKVHDILEDGNLRQSFSQVKDFNILKSIQKLRDHCKHWLLRNRNQCKEIDPHSNATDNI